jgi:hypothetical protein
MIVSFTGRRVPVRSLPAATTGKAWGEHDQGLPSRGGQRELPE